MDPPRKRKGKEIVEDIWSPPRQRSQDQTTVTDQQPTAPFDYPSQIKSPILRMPPQDSSNLNPFSSNPPLNSYPYSGTSGQVTYTGMTQTSTPRQRSQDQTTVNAADQQPTAPFSYPSQIESPILRMPPQDSSNSNPFSSNPPLNPYPYSSTSGQVTYTGMTQTSTPRQRSQDQTTVNAADQQRTAPFRYPSQIESSILRMPPRDSFNSNPFSSNPPLNPYSTSGQVTYTGRTQTSSHRGRSSRRRCESLASDRQQQASGAIQTYMIPPNQYNQIFNNTLQSQRSFPVPPPAPNCFPALQVPPAVSAEGGLLNYQSLPIDCVRPILRIFVDQFSENHTNLTPHSFGLGVLQRYLCLTPQEALSRLFQLHNWLPLIINSLLIYFESSQIHHIPFFNSPAAANVFNNQAGISNTFPSQNQSVPAPVTSYLPLPIQVPPASFGELDYLPMPSMTSTQARDILEIFVRGAHPHETTLNEVFFLNLQRNIGLPEQTGLFHRYQTNGNSLQAVIDHILQYFQYWDTLQNL